MLRTISFIGSSREPHDSRIRQARKTTIPHKGTYSNRCPIIHLDRGLSQDATFLSSPIVFPHHVLPSKGPQVKSSSRSSRCCPSRRARAEPRPCIAPTDSAEEPGIRMRAR